MIQLVFLDPVENRPVNAVRRTRQNQINVLHFFGRDRIRKRVGKRFGAEQNILVLEYLLCYKVDGYVAVDDGKLNIVFIQKFKDCRGSVGIGHKIDIRIPLLEFAGYSGIKTAAKFEVIPPLGVSRARFPDQVHGFIKFAQDTVRILHQFSPAGVRYIFLFIRSNSLIP